MTFPAYVLQVKKSFVPDYYDVIKNPRDLGTIKKNLIRKKYETPQEFYEVLAPAALLYMTHVVHYQVISLATSHMLVIADANATRVELCWRAIDKCRSPAQDMHLFFSNIYTYNGTNSNFGKLGSRVEGLFEVPCPTCSSHPIPAVLQARSLMQLGAAALRPQLRQPCAQAPISLPSINPESNLSGAMGGVWSLDGRWPPRAAVHGGPRRDEV